MQQRIEEQDHDKPLTNDAINELLFANEQLLCEIAAESNQRKNKNFMNASMASMLCELERNLVKLCRSVEPSAMGDWQFMEKQKPALNRMNQKKQQSAPQQKKM